MKKLFIASVIFLVMGNVVSAQEQGLIRATAGIAYGTEIEELGINIGGEYLITDIISGGLSYTSFFTPDPVSFSSINIDGRYYFLTDGPYVFGLLGLGIVRTKIEVPGFFGGGTVSDSETGLNIGGGALFPFTDNLGALTQLKFNTVGDGQFVIQGGITYTF
ncbi:MAG: hypothetical protein AAFY41_14480 [Bacteroidota bacterium]